MKQRSTTPVANTSLTMRACVIAATILALSVAPFVSTPQAKADQYDDQIAALQKEINQYNAQADSLKGKRQSLENQLATLSNQKRQIQAQLDISIAKAQKLARDIADNQRKVDENKSLLGDTIADIYVDNDITPLEMLASSSNIADFVDKQSNRTQVQNTVKTTIAQINKLKAELEQQKKDVDRVVADQQNARKALAAKEAEQQRLIDQTKGQENAFRSLSAKNEQQKLSVQKQQQDAIEAAIRSSSGGGPLNISAGDPNKGGYPWESGCYVDANAISNTTDPLGYGCRQCVSYTAWKVGQRTGNFPRYWGNANQWPGSASASGYKIGSTPRANSVGVISAGAYGHVVWINSVNGDGTVNISQYNYYGAGGPGWGNYSEMRVSASTYDTYIYF